MVFWGYFFKTKVVQRKKNIEIIQVNEPKIQEKLEDGILRQMNWPDEEA